MLSAGRMALVLFLVLGGTFILPHSIPGYSDNHGGQYNSALSSGVLMVLQPQSAPSGQLLSAASGDDVQISTDTTAQNEPSIALDPSDSQQLAAGANDVLVSGVVWLSVYTSADAGLTWTSGLIPSNGPLASFSQASDPGVSFSQNGTLYYSGVAFNIQRNTAVDGTIFVSKSTDLGISFPRTTIVALGSSRIFNDKPYIAVDDTTGPSGGRIYVSWTRFTSSTTSDIMLAYSANAGVSFSSPVRVSTSLLNQGSVPVVGPNGNLHVVWNDLSNSQIEEANSTDGGVQFSSPVVVSPYAPLPAQLPNSFFRVNNNPAAAADDTNDNVYVAWADYSSRFSEIFSSRSTDGGVTWSSPVLVNDDATSNDHFFPWMTVSHGVLSVAWYDRRLDPGNRLIDVFYAESADGLSFSLNLRVTDQSSDPGDLTFIGDYIGIAANGTLAHPVWTDLRNISAGSLSNEDVFTETKPINRPPVLTLPQSQIGYPGANLHFTVNATDPDVGETLIMTDSGAPLGATLSSTPSTSGFVTGVFDWTPTVNQSPGDYSVEFAASDGFLTSKANVSITVNVNSPPSLLIPGPQTVEAGSKLSFIVSATDADAPPDYVTISCNNCAQLGASLDSSSGNFTWIPGLAQGPGDYLVMFTATDHLLPQLSDTQSVAVHVDRQILPPSLAPVRALTVDDETLVSFKANATDSDVPSQPLIFSLGADAPLGASMSTDGVFSWTPTESQGGTYSFTVQVSNGALSDSRMVTVTVTEVELAPVLTDPGPQTVEVGNPLIFSVEATNPDADDPVTLSASNLPAGASFDPLLGSFVWTPSNTTVPGEYTVVFKAVEPGPQALSDTKSLTITVERFSSTSGQPLSLGALGPELWLLAGAAVVIVVLVSAIIVRARRPKRDSGSA